MPAPKQRTGVYRHGARQGQPLALDARAVGHLPVRRPRHANLRLIHRRAAQLAEQCADPRTRGTAPRHFGLGLTNGQRWVDRRPVHHFDGETAESVARRIHPPAEPHDRWPDRPARRGSQRGRVEPRCLHKAIARHHPGERHAVPLERRGEGMRGGGHGELELGGGGFGPGREGRTVRGRIARGEDHGKGRGQWRGERRSHDLSAFRTSSARRFTRPGRTGGSWRGRTSFCWRWSSVRSSPSWMRASFG